MKRLNLGFTVCQNGGFTLVETLVAVIIFSVALVALASVSLTIVGGNKNSRHYVEACILAQSQIELLRYEGFDMGPDGVLGTADDVASTDLSNANSGNDAVTDPATMFASPDHAYAMNGLVESSTTLDSPSLTPGTALRRAWVVRDNVPGTGMKTVTVVVGWKEGVTDFYVVVSTAIQGV